MIHESQHSVIAALQGIATIAEAEPDQRASLGQSLQALDPWSLIIASWRLSDGLAWPWLSLSGGFTSLPWLCQHVTIDPWVFDPEQGVYRNADGQAIVLHADDQASLGLLDDVIESRQAIALAICSRR